MTKDLNPTPTLFTPVKVGNHNLSHRVFLPPLTRMRADDEHVPTDLMAEYYGQRASRSGTLLITEAVFASRALGGYPNVPGLWSQDQVEGWKKTTEKVHEHDSVIFAQIWALGRVANPQYMAAHNLPVIAPSAVAWNDHVPKELTTEEVELHKQSIVSASVNALKANFDGVEIHGANGYLVDQFLHSVTNKRTDKYGGSIENRARLALEIIDETIEAFKNEFGLSYEDAAAKVGIRFSPWGTFQGMEGEKIPNDLATFTYITTELEKRAQDGKRLAYIHVIEPKANEAQGVVNFKKASNSWIYLFWQGVVLRAGGYEYENALEDAQNNENTLIGFGRYYIANPDFVNRMEKGIELNPYDRTSFYRPSADLELSTGYTDYPFAGMQ